MRNRLSLVSSFAIAALCAGAVSPAAAQRATASRYLRPVVERIGITTGAPIVRTVAVYKFTSPREMGLPSEVTLSDSTGQLVATFRLPGARTADPMMVEILDNDLVLQGQTPVGVLTLVLYRQAIADKAGDFIGRYTLAGWHGELRGGALR
jgi:hypothetical protein